MRCQYFAEYALVGIRVAFLQTDVNPAYAEISSDARMPTAIILFPARSE
jgi:hypothetical protein